MQKQFRKLFELPFNLYQKDSPVVLRAGVLFQNQETKQLFILLKFSSVSNKVIQSLKVRIQQMDNADRLLEEEKEIPFLDLKAARNAEFGSKTPIYLENSETRSFSMYVSEVVFTDKKIWSSSDSRWEPLKSALPISEFYPTEEQQEEFQRLFGNKATKMPMKLENTGLWYCTCGNLCHDDESTCPYCGASLNKMLSVNGDTLQKDGIYSNALKNANKYQIPSLKKAIDDFSKIPGWRDADQYLAECKKMLAKCEKELEEETKRKEEETRREAEKKKKTQKKIKITLALISVACLLLVIFLLVKNVILPQKQLIAYEKAVQLASQGDYQSAYNIATANNAPVEFIDACRDIIIENNYQKYVALGNDEIVLAKGTEKVENFAFYGCTSLTSVAIPNSVTSIGGSAFSGCTSLMSITIPNGVTSIGNSAFFGCTSLTNVSIPDSMTSIESSAFENCTALTSITIPDSVESIGSSAFYDCTSLKSVYITDLAKWCTFSFGSSFVGGANLNLYLNGKLVTDLVIPEGVTSIEDYAFCGCTSLTSVTIPDSVTSIGYRAFDFNSLKSVYITDLAKWCIISFYSRSSNPLYYANNLYLNGKLVTDLVIPEGVTSIGQYAFDQCHSLTSVTIPDSVTSIGDCAFSDCNSLKNVTISGGVTRIREFAFSGCSSLKSIAIPDGVTSIGTSAFSDCKSLASVTIPSSVRYIGGSVFYNCSSLKSIAIPDGVTSIGTSAFSGCSSLKSINIPNSVKSIGDSAFYNCTFLTSVTIPDSIKSIEYCVFFGCNSLTSITLPDSVTSIGIGAFFDCTSLASVTILANVRSVGYAAFYNCTSLKNVTYQGTKREWNAISKGKYWDSKTGAYTIHCTDGDITKE